MKTIRQLRQRTTALRRLRGLIPQWEVARAVGIDQSFLSLLEKGRRRPSDEVAKRLARFYEVSVEELFQ